METLNPEIHFENIRFEILKQLENSISSIKIAMAWFTDKEIFSNVIDKAKKGIQIELIINDDTINYKSGINFKTLYHNGGLVYFPSDNNLLIHHKFCIIDNKIVLNGSFNWTNQANYNK